MKHNWTMNTQDRMCYAICTRIHKNLLKYKNTTLTKQIVVTANKFPTGLKQYYADKLLCLYFEQYKRSFK
jgi:hypothetical protein